MAEPISIQQLKDASEDAISLAEFINEPENVMIPRRLASDINSLQYYLEYMKSFSQRSYETYDEMVANASNLSENVSVFVTNDSDTSKNGIYTYNGDSFVKGDYQPENAAKDYVEAKLGGLQVFDGKVRTQDVSTSDGSTQDVKNTEFRNELDALPFEDGLLPSEYVSVDGFISLDNVGNQADVNKLVNKLTGYTVFAEKETTAGIESSEYLQELIDSLPIGGTLDLQGKTYVVAKNTGLDGYPLGDQPCLRILNQKSYTLRNGVISVKEHGQGIFDIKDSSGLIEYMTLSGPAQFPPLDPSRTGRGEKGIETTGYFDSVLYNRGAPRNNSIDTSGYSGGVMGDDGLFPQWGGGRASTWGMWNGGYIFNYGSGIFIWDSQITVQNCDIFGFNGGSITTASDKSVIIRNNKIHDNYNEGIFIKAYAEGSNKSHPFVHVENNIIERIGHPDAKDTDFHKDPGYGVASSNRGAPDSAAFNGVRQYIVLNNYFKNCVRKAIDAHHSNFFRAEGNFIEECGQGILVNLNKSSGYPLATYINNNYLRNITYTTQNTGMGIYVGSSNPDEFEGTVSVTGNILENIGYDLNKIDREAITLDGRPMSIYIAGIYNSTITGNSLRNNQNIYGYCGIMNGIAGANVPPKVNISNNLIEGRHLYGIFAQATGTASTILEHFMSSIITNNFLDIRLRGNEEETSTAITSPSSEMIQGNVIVKREGVAKYLSKTNYGGTIKFKLNLSNLQTSDYIFSDGFEIYPRDIVVTRDNHRVVISFPASSVNIYNRQVTKVSEVSAPTFIGLTVLTGGSSSNECALSLSGVSNGEIVYEVKDTDTLTGTLDITLSLTPSAGIHYIKANQFKDNLDKLGQPNNPRR